ncbi:FAD-dependent oxidoreductase [uncultured Paludibaculum sp.]|uniref:hydroxysqualene dehydroxylase n=1 Tax=uncultured Paludibaculum sp. TaxID=1765020 RepID=UPI002AAA9CA3|nr:FAD-dependent oxidoreductase [uncultured Paludibaculum sp.]
MLGKVAVLGGGVAGLSAAHELAERGFQVHVYERKAVLGGKARSIPVLGSGAGGRADLPGEHGFRFFPGFYQHVTDTMARIPFGSGGNCHDNLVVATRILLARAGLSEITWVARNPRTLDDLRVFLIELLTPLGVPLDEVVFFVSRLIVLATSCPQRRLAEYERIRWWDFIQAPRMSTVYQSYLAQGMTRSLVAMRAEESSTRTVGYILLQLFYGLISPDRVFDRLLAGPTNDVWIHPWTSYLEGLGVVFHRGARVSGISTHAGRVTGVTLEDSSQVTADYYIAALPVEVMATLLTDELKAAAPSLAGIGNLKTRWMNGIQFYLSKDQPLAHGHVIYLDSPWALTSISQRQFWTGIDLAQYGDGAVQGILSVDISDWEAPGTLTGKPARACSAEEIKSEVWHQLKQHLNDGGETTIDDGQLLGWFLDPDIEFPNPGEATNAEPLLINTAGSLQYRPEAQVELENFFVASDYVRTYTDLACMEAANEAARRAVNCLLAASGSTAAPAALWPLEEPGFLKPFQEIDRIRFALGRPHSLTLLDRH